MQVVGRPSRVQGTAEKYRFTAVRKDAVGRKDGGQDRVQGFGRLTAAPQPMELRKAIGIDPGHE